MIGRTRRPSTRTDRGSPGRALILGGDACAPIAQFVHAACTPRKMPAVRVDNRMYTHMRVGIPYTRSVAVYDIFHLYKNSPDATRNPRGHRKTHRPSVDGACNERAPNWRRRSAVRQSTIPHSTRALGVFQLLAARCVSRGKLVTMTCLAHVSQ